MTPAHHVLLSLAVRASNTWHAIQVTCPSLVHCRPKKRKSSGLQAPCNPDTCRWVFIFTCTCFVSTHLHSHLYEFIFSCTHSFSLVMRSYFLIRTHSHHSDPCQDRLE